MIRRAPNAVRGVVRPGRGASAEARGVSAGSEVSVCNSATSRLREARGSLPGVQGSRKAPPADVPNPGSVRTPGFSMQRAGSPGARVPCPKLGRRDLDPDAVHLLWPSPAFRGEPHPSAPRPAASIRPQPPAQREIKPPAITLLVFGDFTRGRRRAAGRWDFGEGVRRRTPLSPPASGRIPGSNVKVSPPPSPHLSPLPPLLLRSLRR